MEKIVKVLIVDDHKIFRTGLEMILNGFDFVKVMGQASNGKEMFRQLKKSEVDLVFMDIKMPEESGIDLSKKLSEKYPDIKIIGLTMYGEVEYFNKMLEASASGFLLKHTQEEELEVAIRTVMNGDYYFSEEFRSNLDHLQNQKPKAKISLTSREIEILELISKGYSNQEIADRLYLSIHTVDGHRRNLISKTGVKNTASLVSYAIKNQLIRL
jgi:DNA-binding NarL/FixJ family response regulator